MNGKSLEEERNKVLEFIKATRDDPNALEKLLLQHGAEYADGICDANGTSLFHFAAAANNAESLTILCKYSQKITVTRDNDGNTALHTALYHLAFNSAEFLIQQGLSLVDVNKRNVTCYQVACQNCPEYISSKLNNVIPWHDNFLLFSPEGNILLNLLIASLWTAAMNFIKVCPLQFFKLDLTNEFTPASVIFASSLNCNAANTFVIEYITRTSFQEVLLAKDMQGYSVLSNVCESNNVYLLKNILSHLQSHQTADNINAMQKAVTCCHNNKTAIELTQSTEIKLLLQDYICRHFINNEKSAAQHDNTAHTLNTFVLPDNTDLYQQLTVLRDVITPSIEFKKFEDAANKIRSTVSSFVNSANDDMRLNHFVTAIEAKDDQSRELLASLLHQCAIVLMNSSNLELALKFATKSSKFTEANRDLLFLCYEINKKLNCTVEALTALYGACLKYPQDLQLVDLFKKEMSAAQHDYKTTNSQNL